MDISTIVANPRTFDIKHPATGEPIGLKITVLPSSDPKVKAARRKLLNDRLHRNHNVTAERIEQSNLALLESAVSGWEWEGELTFENGKPDFSEQALRKVLRALPWVKDQIDEELGNDAAFFEASATA